MVHNDKKNEKKQADSLKTSIYAVYDTVLKQFEPPFACQDSHIDDFMKLSVNDVQSRYYGHESDFILNKIAIFSQDTGEINQLSIVERIKFLDFYIDNSKRKLQTIIQTLNFLPSGYFKMPQEQKQSIQDSIDKCINDYVENYVVPDMDVNNITDNYIRGVQVRLNLLRTQIEGLNTNKSDRDYTLSLLDKVLVNKE